MNFKISCLVFIHNHNGEILLLKRNKPPNLGFWSPPGGKLEMSRGESPFECVRREAFEETGLSLENEDLSLFGYVSEKAYEQKNHWLMFLFHSKKRIDFKPNDIDEGTFAFFKRETVENLAIPTTDHELIWPFYDKRFDGFWGVSADCSGGKLKIKIEATPLRDDN